MTFTVDRSLRNAAKIKRKKQTHGQAVKCKILRDRLKASGYPVECSRYLERENSKLDPCLNLKPRKNTSRDDGVRKIIQMCNFHVTKLDFFSLKHDITFS